MGKLRVDHRIVIRDQHDKIVSDVHAPDFAAARPLYEAALLDMRDGQTVALQHGARVVRASNKA
jgi:hypothetical protein